MTLLFVSLLFLLSLLFEFCSPSLPFGWCCFCPPLVTAIGAGGFVNTLLFCCCCCCCCEREREREDVSHRESKKRDDTFSTERARTRKGVRGKEVLLLRRLVVLPHLVAVSPSFLLLPSEPSSPSPQRHFQNLVVQQLLAFAFPSFLLLLF